ncbi:MAG: hypothetical protein AAFN79_17405 [Pseudomonadota bacterium]
MFQYLWQSRRYLAFAGMVGWAAASLTALLIGWPQIFSALGAFALALGFGVFLTDRFQLSEQRRYWDSLVETQQRLTWRYLKRLRREDDADPRALDDLEAQIDESFESLLEAKAAEKSAETYRLEMTFSIVGTLQWGFGVMLVRALHG